MVYSFYYDYSILSMNKKRPEGKSRYGRSPIPFAAIFALITVEPFIKKHFLILVSNND